ncbi:MAG: acetyl ornithine aminotransferase family protein [Thermoplasmatota archaeon]
MAIRGNETRPKLITSLPGPNAKKIVKKDTKYLMTTTKCAPVAAARARGVVVEDVDGNRLLDFASGIGVINTGHCHPKVVKAVQDQAAKLIHFAGTDFYYDVQADLAERLNGLVPIKGNTKTFFCQSGAEANEAAFKVARNHAGKRQFVAFQGAFHGRTMGALSLTHSKAMQQMGNFPSMPGVHHTPFPSAYKNMWGINGYEEPDELSNRALDALEYLFETKLPVEDTAALFWEPVQGEGGYHVTPKPFAKGLQKICNDNDILLVADEVQTGFGRTGKWFASEHFGVNPDMISIAKAMGSGMPIGAQIVRADLDLPEQGIHSNTYGGNLVACAASLATIDVLGEEKLIENSAKMGDYLGKHLNDIKEDFRSVGDARGIGLMRAMEFNKADGTADAKLRDKVEEQAWKKGLVLLGCGKSGIRFIPSLNVTKGQIDGAMDVLRDAMRAAKA